MLLAGPGRRKRLQRQTTGRAESSLRCRAAAFAGIEADLWHASAVLPLIEPLYILVANHAGVRLRFKQEQLRRQLVRAHAADVAATMLQNIHCRRGARTYLV